MLIHVQIAALKDIIDIIDMRLMRLAHLYDEPDVIIETLHPEGAELYAEKKAAELEVLRLRKILKSCSKPDVVVVSSNEVLF